MEIILPKKKDSQNEIRIDSNSIVIIGANGSGKSNLMKPLAFLSWFMTSSFQDIKQDGKIPVVSYETNPDEPTTIEVEFCIPHFTDDGKSDAIECKYFVELDQNRVYKEELKLKTSRLYSRVFYREFDKAKNKYAIEHFNELNKQLEEKEIKQKYIFNFLSPTNYSDYFTYLRDERLLDEKYKSELDIQLTE